MDAVNDFFTAFSSFLWGWPMIILLLGTHIFLTIRLRFPQRKIFKAIKLSVKRDKDATGDVSQFGALATALAATIGTGNIIGVATAIALGGPGAVLWCWLTGVFGISTKYAEGLLAVKYRVKTRRGRMLGGPMYALEKGLGWKGSPSSSPSSPPSPLSASEVRCRRTPSPRSWKTNMASRLTSRARWSPSSVKPSSSVV